MTEDEAKAWIETTFGASSLAKLAAFAAAVRRENEVQNLIAPSTVASIWTRHIADSAQLVTMASEHGTWLDIGTGAGFPGLVVAILRDAPIAVVEPRRRRAAFLRECAAAFSLGNVTVVENKVEQVALPSAVISARAVAPVEKLLQAAAHCATTSTRWLLPRGASGHNEFAALESRWRVLFHMKQSLTDAASIILTCDGLAPR